MFQTKVEDLTGARFEAYLAMNIQVKFL